MKERIEVRPSTDNGFFNFSQRPLRIYYAIIDGYNNKNGNDNNDDDRLCVVMLARTYVIAYKTVEHYSYIIIVYIMYNPRAWRINLDKPSLPYDRRVCIIIRALVCCFQLGTVEGLPGGRHRNPITRKPDDALDRLAGRVVRAVHAQFRSRQHPGRLGRAAGSGPDQAHRE